MKSGATLAAVRAAKSRAADMISPLVGEEVAVGITRIGDDRFALKINLTCEPDADVELPAEIDGVPIRIEVVGRIRKR